MAIMLYDLAGAEDERRFSPYCWRVKLALAHKGLDFATIPWRFTEKDRIAFSGQGAVPVLVDGERVVADSWAIAEYLDAAYPQVPLFATPAEHGLARFAGAWVDTVLLPAVVRLLMLDILAHLHEKDRAYFRQSREAHFGMSLEAYCADRDGRLAALQPALRPLRLLLRNQPYLGGVAPHYADYAIFGVFQSARCISPLALLAADDPVAAWRGRLLAIHGGLAGKALGYKC